MDNPRIRRGFWGVPGCGVGGWCGCISLLAEAQVAADPAVALVEQSLFDEAIEVPLHAAERAQADTVGNLAQCRRHLVDELVNTDEIVDSLAGRSGNMIQLAHGVVLPIVTGKMMDNG